MRSDVNRVRIAYIICGIMLATAWLPAPADIIIDQGRGPVTVYVPDSYEQHVPTPLICVLHGYTGSGAWQESYYQFLPLSEEYGFLYFFPNGTVDQAGDSFWNATDACCDFYDSGVDDSGYLRSLVQEIQARLNVDSRRIYFVGLSNGGFMSYRMACDHPELIAAIVSQAGATFADPADCDPSSPVHVLQIHGTADNVVLYNGGIIYGVPYPGAVESVEQWALFDGCADIGIYTPPLLDLDAGIPGAETEVYRYTTDCDPDGSGELWKILGGSHVPPLTEHFSPLVIEWLLSHSKSEATAVDGGFVSAASGTGPLLLPANPNPFNPTTRLSYRLDEASTVDLIVHDLAGRTIRTLVDGEERAAGDHQIVWDGRGDQGAPLASGVYFVSLEAKQRRSSQKVILIK